MTPDDLTQAARAGDVDAMLELGDTLAGDQRGVEAARWYEAAAATGELTAPRQLGDLYRRGCGDLAADPQRAHAWYARSLALHEPMLGDGGDYAAWALLNVGELLLAGLGAERDEPRAIALLEQSRALGNGHAVHVLARHWLRDPANAQDVARGIAVLEAAATDPYAMSQLASWYGPYGGGTDLRRECHWLERLAATGDMHARDRLRAIEAERRRVEQRTDAIAQAEAAVADGTPGARRQLSALLAHAGRHADSIAVAEQAHAAGEDWAWFNLAMRYRLGNGVPADPAKARHWKHAGARLGDPGAMLQLADDLFESGADPALCAAWVAIAELPRYGGAYGLPNDESREATKTYTARFDGERRAAVRALVARHEADRDWWPGDA